MRVKMGGPMVVLRVCAYNPGYALRCRRMTLRFGALDTDRPRTNINLNLMKSIAVIPKSTTQVFWKTVEAGAREGAKEAGVEMVWKGSLNEDDPAADPNR